MEDKFDVPFGITGFSTQPGRGMGQYGFNIALDANIAKRIVESPIQRHSGTRLHDLLMYELCKDSSGQKYLWGHIQYHEDSWLITRIQHPFGDCACFGIDGGYSLRDNVIKYYPHNIDSTEQSSTILAVWLKWWETMSWSVLKLKVPFG